MASREKSHLDRPGARQLHDESIIVDGNNASYFFDSRVFVRLQQGGVTAVNATIAAWHNPAETMAQIETLGQLYLRHADIIAPVLAVDDILTVKAAGQVGLIMGFQDTAPLGDELDLLARYHERGLRILQLTYNHANRVGAGCLEPVDGGLTAFGREVIAGMNRLGILVDVSHCGPRTSLEAIEASQKPVAITHANALVVFNHPRNKGDDAIRALAARGGVIGAVAFPGLLTRRMPATLDDYMAAIDYLVNLVGVDHVGLGPDFMEEMPAEIAAQVLRGAPPAMIQQFQSVPPMSGFETAAAFPNVTAALLDHGYPPDAVKKIMGGNWLRLYKEVW